MKLLINHTDNVLVYNTNYYRFNSDAVYVFYRPDIRGLNYFNCYSFEKFNKLGNIAKVTIL